MLKRILLFHLHVAPDNQYCISGKGRCRRLKSLHMQKIFRRPQCADYKYKNSVMRICAMKTGFYITIGLLTLIEDVVLKL